MIIAGVGLTPPNYDSVVFTFQNLADLFKDFSFSIKALNLLKVSSSLFRHW
jgi:hypothetical protein